MAILHKQGTQVGTYTIAKKLEETEKGVFTNRYSAADRAGKVVQLLQYKSPSQQVDWFDEYIQYHKTLSELIRSNADLCIVCEPTLDIFLEKNTFYRVTPPRPSSLDSVMASETLDDKIRLACARSLTQSLATLHRFEIVRVDLSPKSIGIREDGSVFFLDLDWARLSETPMPWEGRQGEVCVKGYAAPELKVGEKATVASDVYALGCILKELLSEPPPSGPDGERLITLIESCLSVDSDERQSAKEVADAFSARTYALQRIPYWISAPMQALAFWVAYQNEIYRHHHLPEGALVAELARLIHGAIPSHLRLICEPLCLKFASESQGEWRNNQRVDLAIEEYRVAENPPRGIAVLEVKRYSAPQTELEHDLVKLKYLKESSERLSTYLLVVAQEEMPDIFVSPNGIASSEIHTLCIEDENKQAIEIQYKVRLVKKASASFKSIWTATYCCLVEVL